MSEHWSDVMPALDLGTDGCVPYRRGGVLYSTTPTNAGSIAHLEGGKVEQPALDHPAGLGFALRWLEQHGPPTWEDGSHYAAYQAELHGILMRWLLGLSSRDDLDLVARACAEVAP